MKNQLLFLIFTVGLLFAACQQTPEKASVDIAAEEAAVDNTLEGLMDVWKAKDLDSMKTFIADDALICGSDPSEFWNKEEVLELWKQMLGETSPEMDYLGDRTVKVAPDGNSAIVVEQFYGNYTPDIPWRNVFSLIKLENRWLISFMSTSLIPENEYLSVINEAVAGEEDEE